MRSLHLAMMLHCLSMALSCLAGAAPLWLMGEGRGRPVLLHPEELATVSRNLIRWTVAAAAAEAAAIAVMVWWP